MSVVFITPTDIISRFTYNSFVDVDVSDLVPAGATGVILQLSCTSASAYAIKVRKNGSTDNLTSGGVNLTHSWFGIGVDASRIFEGFVNDNPPGTNVHCYLMGYTRSEHVWWTNALDKTPAGAGSYNDVNIAADTGADTALGVWGKYASSSQNWAVRQNGSTDDRYTYGDHAFLIGVDGSEIFEMKVASAAVHFHLHGYVKAEATFNANATDQSLGSTGSYVDLAALPAGGIASIHEVIQSTYGNYHLRKNGASDEVYLRPTNHCWAVVEADVSRVVEGKISSTSVDWFLVGYLSQGAPNITSLTPDHGIPGDSVTIAGTGFGAAQGTGYVTFYNGKTAAITSWTDTQIVCTVPGAVTTGNLTVTTDGGTTSNGVTFTVDYPHIDSLAPTHGTATDEVTITGTYFEASQGGGYVQFNGVTAAIISWSATSIVAVAPGGVATGYVVVHTNAGLTSNGISWIVDSPVVTPPVSGVLLYVDVALTTDPSATASWEPVSAYIRQMRTRRGRQHELDRIEAGTATVLLNNRDRRFDPTDTGGPYYGNLLPMRRIRIRGAWNGVFYPIFYGYIETWPPSWPHLGYDALVEVQAVDGLKVLALKKLNALIEWPQEKTDRRVARVLDEVGWTLGEAWVLDNLTFTLGTNTRLGPYGDRALGFGSSSIQAATPTDEVALDHIRTCEEVENGVFLASADGLATFRGRTWPLQAANLVSLATFGDAPGELPYRELIASYDDSHIYNEIRVTATGGTLQTANDTTSQGHYYKRTLSHENIPLAGTDYEAKDQADYLLARYKDPTLRFTQMVLKPLRDPDNLWPQVMGREIGDRITVRRRPLGGGSLLEQEVIIQSIEHDIKVEDWTTTWELSPASGANYPTYWLLEDATYGVLGTTTRLGY